MTEALKIESGLQLLARLAITFDLSQFYPVLFENGLKANDVVEISGDSDCCKTFLLIDFICHTILPKDFGGLDTGFLVFNSDGNFSLKTVYSVLEEKIKCISITNDEMNVVIEKTMSKLFILNIYDAEQFQVTLENLENILADNPTISLIAVDTLTAFYWAEQPFKLTKMDLYLRSCLKNIQKFSQEQKIPIIYTKPLYFGSEQDNIRKKLDAVSDHLTYRLNISKNCNNSGISYEVVKQTHYSYEVKHFCITNYIINWISN